MELKQFQIADRIRTHVLSVYNLYLHKYIPFPGKPITPVLEYEDQLELGHKITNLCLDGELVKGKPIEFPIVVPGDQQEFIGALIDFLEDYIDERHLRDLEEIHIEGEKYDELANQMTVYFCDHDIFA